MSWYKRIFAAKPLNDKYFTPELVNAPREEFNIADVDVDWGDSSVVATLNGKRIGFLQFRNDDLQTVHIPALRVYPAYQGRGVAKKMLNFFLDYAKSAKQWWAVSLDVTNDNEVARGVYRAMGFEGKPQPTGQNPPTSNQHRMLYKLPPLPFKQEGEA